ncbi:MAG: class I SAM-dependent methyltransferase [bacterium]|nr:MAG: class I SAM-dependent methyltransferase [bacterium]
MKLLTNPVLIFLALSCACTTAHAGNACMSEADPAWYDIPKVRGVTIDGSDGDWGAQGFRVDHVATPDGSVRPAEDFDVRFRLGWNEEGLLVIVTVQDDIPREAPQRIWRLDCVELYVGERIGSSNYYQVIVSSGADPEFGSLRQRIFDKRPEDLRGAELAVQAASRIVDDGYIIEALFPWKNIGASPEPGALLAFQLTANDDDGGSDEAGGALRVAWYPDTRTHEDPGMMHVIRLADEAGEPVQCRVDREIDHTGAILYVRGTHELVGKEVTVRGQNNVIARAELKYDEGHAGAGIRLDGTEAGTVPAVNVELSGTHIAMFEELPTLSRILDGYIEAAGGPDAIRNLTTRVCSGHLIHTYPRRDPPAETVLVDAYAQIPGKWAVTLQYASGDVQFGCDGDIGWVKDAEGSRRDERMDKLPLGLFLNPHGARLFNDYFGTMILKEKAKCDDRTVFVLQLIEDGQRRPVWFDAELGLLIRIGSWSLGDYRAVNGVVFPHRIAAARRGGESIYEFSEVRHNEPIDNARFTMLETAIVVTDVFGGIDNTRVLPMLKHLPYKHGGMNIPPRDGRLLYNLIIANGYTRGLEIGTSNGYSTLWLGLAFAKTGGEVITLEIEEARGMEARDNFRRAGLDRVIDARIADALEEIPRIEGSFDFIFIDAWKPDYINYLELLRDRVTPGGAITAHNILSHGPDMRRFLEILESDPGLETTIYRTSEAGVSISIVRK